MYDSLRENDLFILTKPCQHFFLQGLYLCEIDAAGNKPVDKF